MNLNLKKDKKLLLIPAILSFILTLLLIYKYSYPISWDVYYHIHMINLYSNNGLVFWDYQTVAPVGRLIMYPPLFHLIFMGISKITGINSIDLCRLAQPIFSFYLIGVITLVSYKISDNIEKSLLTGLLSMICFVTFNRSVICTPATIAIGLSMITTSYFYKGINDENLKNIVISAITLGLIANLHMATAILSAGVLGLYALIQLIRRKVKIKNLTIFLIISAIISLPWWIYVAFNYTLIFNSIGSNNLGLHNFFFKYYGIVPSILLIIGYYVIYKEKSELSLYLAVWSLSLLLLSQINYIGFQTVSIRILEVDAYALIIISGIGLHYLYEKISKEKIKQTILIIIIIYATLSALIYVDSYTPDVLTEKDYNTTILPNQIHLLINPVTTIYKPTIISSRFANSTLAHQRYDVLKWFEKEKSSKVVVSEDSIMDTIIVSTSNTPVVYGGFTESIPEYVTDPVHIIKGWSNKQELHDSKIGYILLKKDTDIPYYAQKEYENNNYKITKIREKYL